MADWYYTANGQQSGPVDLQALRQLLAAGSVSHADLVYGPGLTQWTPAGQVPALSEGSAATGDAPGAAAPMIGYRGVETGVTGLSAVAMDALRGTKPWVRFLSVMTFISAGFMAVAGLIMLLAGAMMRRGGNGGLPGWVGGIYLALAAIYVIPAVLLTSYANAIGSLMRTQRMSDVERALGAQRTFWKFSGIITIIVIGLYILAIVAMVIFRLRF